MSENYEQPSELKSVPNEAVATDAVPTICKACGADWKQHSPIMYWCPNGKTRWEPNTPASDQPERPTCFTHECAIGLHSACDGGVPFSTGMIPCRCECHRSDQPEKCPKCGSPHCECFLEEEDQPEYRPLAGPDVIRAGDSGRPIDYKTNQPWSDPYLLFGWPVGSRASDFKHWEFRRPIAAEKREDTRTCGEISCDECNERYQKAIVEISTLQQQLAQVQKLNDIMHKFSVFCHSKTCIHHTDAERQGSGCPVCLQKQLAQEKEERLAWEKRATTMKFGNQCFEMQRDNIKIDRDNLREALRRAAVALEKSRRFLPTHGTHSEDLINGHEDALTAASAALQQSEGK